MYMLCDSKISLSSELEGISNRRDHGALWRTIADFGFRIICRPFHKPNQCATSHKAALNLSPAAKNPRPPTAPQTPVTTRHFFMPQLALSPQRRVPPTSPVPGQAPPPPLSQSVSQAAGPARRARQGCESDPPPPPSRRVPRRFAPLALALAQPSRARAAPQRLIGRAGRRTHRPAHGPTLRSDGDPPNGRTQAGSGWAPGQPDAAQVLGSADALPP